MKKKRTSSFVIKSSQFHDFKKLEKINIYN